MQSSNLEIQVGEVIIHNDVIGIVTSCKDDTCVVVDMEDKSFNFSKCSCTSVIKPAALAKLFYEKLVKPYGKV